MEKTVEKTVKKAAEEQTNEKKENIRPKSVIAFIRESRKLITSAIIGIVVIAVLSSILFAKERNVKTVAESSLKEVVEVCELSTVEFIYNSTVTVKDEENKDKYHVAYEGVVNAGFDFNKITTEMDKENKKIVIVIPKIKINSVNINDETLDFIFVKDKYDTETTFQEAYKVSYEDLEKKAETNQTVKKMAYENAVDTMKAIIIPLESKLPKGYSFDFREGSEAK